MPRASHRIAICAATFGLCLAGRAPAQESPPPPPPPPVWTGSLGAGLSITGGNTDTTSYNLSFTAQYDPKRRDVFKAEGLYLRGSTNDVVNVDKATLGLRYEYKITDRIFAFGQVGYLHDRFKDITYLITPMVGAGYNVLKEKDLTLAFDAAIGGAFEKNSGFESRSSAALQLGEAFMWKFSPTATLTQKATGLWKANDTSDSLYHFEIGLAAQLVKRIELKVAFVDDYKNKPSDPRLKKNDTALVAALVVKL